MSHDAKVISQSILHFETKQKSSPDLQKLSFASEGALEESPTTLIRHESKTQVSEVDQQSFNTYLNEQALGPNECQGVKI